MSNPIYLGINIDHVATLRQARMGLEPSLIEAANAAIAGGADGITIHLREDRRHIQDHDVTELRAIVPRLNLEMGATDEMIQIAVHVHPDFACLVPEKRAELTTEGGLDVITNLAQIRGCVAQLSKNHIEVYLFIDPDLRQIAAAKASGATGIEIHTGRYAEHPDNPAYLREISEATAEGIRLGLKVNAGHGLNYSNVGAIAEIRGLSELNIGHSIVSRSVFVGLTAAVREMKSLVISGRDRHQPQ